MTRLEGFLFGYPGLRSLSVPYFDTNDFFFSGHVGTCFIIALEYRSAKWFKMYYFTVFIMLNQWLMMCLVRTHYIIDLVTGLIVAHYMYIWAEKLSWITDSLVMGIPSYKRPRLYWTPCKCCGWGYLHAADYMSTDEKNDLKVIYQNYLI